MDSNKKQSIILYGIISVLVINLILVGYLFNRNTEFKHQLENHSLKGERPNGGPADILIKQLNFTPIQAQKFRLLANNHHQGAVNITESIKRDKHKIAEILKQDITDTLEAELIAKDIAERQIELEMMTFKHLIEVRKLCTKDQIPKFNDFIGRMAEMLDNRRENRPPPPPREE